MLALKYMLIAAGVMLSAAVFVLKESEVERIGGDRPVAVDVHALVATHRNLGDGRSGEFSERYLSSCSGVSDYAASSARAARGYSGAGGVLFPVDLRAEWLEILVCNSEAMELLQQSPWKANIRELRNAVGQLLLMAGEAVDRETVEAGLGSSSRSTGRTRENLWRWARVGWRAAWPTQAPTVTIYKGCPY